MAADIVRDSKPWEPSRNVRMAWTLRRKSSPKRWAPDLGNGVYVKEAKTPAGFLCFRVMFPNGKYCTKDTLAEAQEYAERHASDNSVN